MTEENTGFAQILSEYIDSNKHVTAGAIADASEINRGSFSTFLRGALPKPPIVARIMRNIPGELRMPLLNAYLNDQGISADLLKGSMQHDDELTTQFKELNNSTKKLILSIGRECEEDPMFREIIMGHDRMLHRDRLMNPNKKKMDIYQFGPPADLHVAETNEGHPLASPEQDNAEETTLKPGTRLPTSSDKLGGSKGQSA